MAIEKRRSDVTGYIVEEDQGGVKVRFRLKDSLPDGTTHDNVQTQWLHFEANHARDFSARVAESALGKAKEYVAPLLKWEVNLVPSKGLIGFRAHFMWPGQSDPSVSHTSPWFGVDVQNAKALIGSIENQIAVIEAMAALPDPGGSKH